MEAPRLERKLVAILAADVEGYSRHMEQATPWVVGSVRRSGATRPGPVSISSPSSWVVSGSR
jgi:hypothetical protein